MTRRGFTLVELLVALVMLGVVSASVYQLLVSNQRVYRQQTQRIELNDNLRSAIAMVPGELRELSANDPSGTDIIAMAESSITYKAMRNLYVTCQPMSQATPTILVLDTAVIGLRALDPERDSVLILADRDTGTPRDDVWSHQNVVTVTRTNICPGGAPSLTVTLSPGVAAADSNVLAGHPVRGFEVQEIRKYPDAGGNLWLGARRYTKSPALSPGWQGLQPVVGPLAGRGLVLAYFDSTGAVTTDRTLVARVSVTVIGRTAQPVQTGGTVDYLLDTLVTNVALRNNR